MTRAPARVAIVTGANRGIGYETCRALASRGLRVVLTSRDAAKGAAAARELADSGADVVHHELDVTDDRSIGALVRWAESELGRIDVLVNNAALYLDESVSVLDVDLATARATIETNLYGPLLLCQAVAPGMIRRRYGRIVNVSSGAGQLSTMGDYAPSYSMSKAALNALTRMVADAVQGKNILVNAADPGWVRTTMGGRSAPRSVAQGADTIVWLATLPDDGPTGGFFHDRAPMPW
jgi:NAD(P)-dependent dehydrogenase (short-subunit alcohol dehydrogenase family)